jgi:CVNH domain
MEYEFSLYICIALLETELLKLSVQPATMLFHLSLVLLLTPYVLSSGFTLSYNNIDLHENTDYTMFILSATCFTTKGLQHYTEINLDNYIGNNDGQLTIHNTLL